MSAEGAVRGPIGAGRWDEALNSHFSNGFVAGDLVFVSGQLPVDEDFKLVGGDDVEAQARQVFGNIERILGDAGATLDDIVAMNLFFMDVEDTSRIAAVRREIFGEHRPASTAVGTSGLLLEGAKLEVNAIAYRQPAGERAS
jgi:enamine deaminase RidA (YjgF/YER057c/UK114 family)